jgi:hypothetical protein
VTGVCSTAAVWISIVAAASVRTDAETRVTCRVEADPDKRVYVLEQHEGRWRLSFRSVATGDQWVRLALPGAAPAFDGENVTLSYRNANGGRQVDLVAAPGRSSLDVWVDYGLDVNIEPDLDPRVDLMTTEGPLPSVTCLRGGPP